MDILARAQNAETLRQGTANASLTASVVVCTRYRQAHLRRCLLALTSMSFQATEILVVDNTSGDPDAHRAAKEFQAEYLVEPRVGLSRARNRGLKESTGHVVLYLDDDAIPDSYWIERMVAPFTNPLVAVVTGKIVSDPPIGSISASDNSWMVSKDLPNWFEIAAFGGLGLGSNMAVRREFCTEPLFDERLGKGAPFEQGEENFAFLRLLSRGYVAVHLPSALIYHADTELHLKRFATCSFAYWLLLMDEYPEQRGTLIRFLWRRLRRIPLPWPRNPQQAGAVISAGWRLYLRAGIRGTILFLRHRKFPRQGVNQGCEPKQ